MNGPGGLRGRDSSTRCPSIEPAALAALLGDVIGQNPQA